jgi:hypothetical protein
MEPEYYSPSTELMPTFPIVVITALLGMSVAPMERPSVAELSYQEIAPWVECAYTPAAQILEQDLEIQVLKKFAENLLTSTEDSPQEVIDVVNKHFWDLV